MLGKYTKSIGRCLALSLLSVFVLLGNTSFASIIEYEVDIFGPGFKAKGPEVFMDLQSWGTITGKFNDGVLSDITGETTFITITEGYIASGLNQFDNYVFGTFNDYAPEFFRGKGVFLDLSRGAEYEETIVTESIIREWAWALYVFDDNFENEAERKDRNSDNYRTIRRQNKTFHELCSYIEDCKAGGEFFANNGKRIPDTPIPLPAAFYLFSAGLTGLIAFSRKRKSA